MTSRDFKKLQKQRELENKVEDFVTNTGKAVRNLFKAETKREKLIKGSLAAVFLAVAVPYTVEEVTEQDLVPLTVLKKQKIEEVSCTTIIEKYKSVIPHNSNSAFSSASSDRNSVSVQNNTTERKRDCTTETRYILEMSDGKTYEVEPNLLQGFTKSDLDDLWDKVRADRSGYFTTSKTITGKNIITDYKRFRSDYTGFYP